jgi:hypothetical protein
MQLSENQNLCFDPRDKKRLPEVVQKNNRHSEIFNLNSVAGRSKVIPDCKKKQGTRCELMQFTTAIHNISHFFCLNPTITYPFLILLIIFCASSSRLYRSSIAKIEKKRCTTTVAKRWNKTKNYFEKFNDFLRRVRMTCLLSERDGIQMACWMNSRNNLMKKRKLY